MLLSGPRAIGRLVRVRSRAPNVVVDTYGSFSHRDFTSGNVADSLVPFVHQDFVNVAVLKVGGRKEEGGGSGAPLPWHPKSCLLLVARFSESRRQ